jgi:Ankyrin repeats (many copies)
VIDTARRKRGARGPSDPTDATRKLHQAYQSGNEEAMIAVFEEHPDLAGLCPPDGRTLLYQMSGRGALRVMKWLLDHGAKVNRKSDEGWTPLDFAATGRGGDWIFDNAKFDRVAELLVKHGAELSPLSAAVLGRWDYLRGARNKNWRGKAS